MNVLAGFISLLILLAMFKWMLKPLLDRPDNFEGGFHTEEERKQELRDKYGSLTADEILFLEDIEPIDKTYLLREVLGYSEDEFLDLVDIKSKAIRKAKLQDVRRKILQKAEELYGNIPTDDSRAPISEDVKAFVWRRDSGKCVKCGSQEKLEFDHIIPHSRGGSDTERNIQLLCEKCNRNKGASI